MIKKKPSIEKILYETNRQKSFFGRDNLSFKIINMGKNLNLYNLCNCFRLKKNIIDLHTSLKIIEFKKL